MKKELYFDCHSGLQISALAEDGRLVELALENESRKNIVGNVYKGRVENIIESMNAAFISCGLEKNCYLSLSGAETVIDTKQYHSKSFKGIKENNLRLSVGDEIVVQVLKAPRGTKGAKVTTKLSFVGKSLIFLPETNFLGISRKIQEEELRENLLFTVDQMRGRNNGLIVRTVAPYTTFSRLKAEVEYLKNLYSSVLEKNKTAKVGDVLYCEAELPIRVLRDSFDEDIEKIVVGEKKLYDRILSLVSLRPDYTGEKIELYEGDKDMLSHFGLFSQIEELSSAKVELPNGGNLVIERTEAMTVVDVNTGRFVGDENLEGTVYSTNIQAAREIARQVRLRDIGGIVVVDFIDMTVEKHKKAVIDELTQSLSFDRAKCKVLPMNELCLATFTRKRMSGGVASKLLQPCPHCKQSGYIFSAEFTVCLLRAQLLDKLTGGEACLIVEVNDKILDFIVQKRVLKRELARYADRQVYFVPRPAYHEERFKINAYASRKQAKIPDGAIQI